MSNIKKITNKNLNWINICSTSVKEIEFLRHNFQFHEDDLRDCASPAQRGKVLEYKDYLFMVITFPVYNRDTQKIEVAEIDFFIGKDYLITVHRNKLTPLTNFFQECDTSFSMREKYTDNTVAKLIHKILDELLISCFPMLDHMYEDTERLAKQMFRGQERQLVEDILAIKSNIVVFRKVMKSHKNFMKKLVEKGNSFFDVSQLKNEYNNLIEHTKDIWDILEGQRETIDAVEDTNNTLISFRLNDIMKTLTIFSVIVFPLTLLAAIFGMNTTTGMPFINNPHGFWIIVCIMFVGIIGMFGYFKHKKWL